MTNRQRWWFHLWMRLALFAIRGMGRNAVTHKRTMVANRVMHTIVAGDQEVVFTWADLTKPSGLSREEIIEMERMVASERRRQGWQDSSRQQ